MSLSTIIVIVTSVVSIYLLYNQDILEKFLFHPVSIKSRGEYYRFLTSGFTHANGGHLFINMYAFWDWGEFIEEIFVSKIFGDPWGKIAFIFFYLSAIAVASIHSYFRYQDQDSYRAVGASGAVAAMIFPYILMQPWDEIISPPFPNLLFAIGYLAYSLYMDKYGKDNIGHNAHFWGAIYGLVFILISTFLLAPGLIGSS